MDRRGVDKTLGLKAVEGSREARNKQFRPPVRVGVWFAMIIAVATVLRWRCTLSEMDEQRQVLMAKQRTVEAELGPKWLPLRDRLEAWTVELAKAPEREVVEKDELTRFGFRERAGLYLRARLEEAQTPEKVREAAKSSLRDAFTSCLTRGAAASPVAGKECEKTRECPPGEFCNELNHCGPPTQPYNLRAAYKTLHMLSPEWITDVQDTTNDLRLELLIRSFEDSTRDDLPLAADLLTRATYYLVVLDDRPGLRPLSADEIDAGVANAADQDTLAGKVYPSRVALWRLEDGKLLLDVRRTPSAALVGGTPLGDAAILAARQRQAQSCGLALAVREALGETLPSVPPSLDDPPAPGASGSAAPSVAPSAGSPPSAGSAGPSGSSAPSAGSAAPSSSASPR